MVTLLAIAVTAALGLPIAWRAGAGGGMLAALSFLYGTGVSVAAMCVMSGRWSVVWVLGVAATLTVIVTVILGVARDQGGASAHDSRQLPPKIPSYAQDDTRRWHLLPDAILLLTLTAYAIWATLAPPNRWDFWGMWGLKGHAFFAHGGIDFAFLQRASNFTIHPDYPLLVPLQYAFFALIGGGWDDRWLGLTMVAYGAALLLIIRSLARTEAGAMLGSFATVAILPFALTQDLGTAEAAFLAFGTAGLLFARAGQPTHAALLLGLASFTKNEGVALIVAVAIGLAAARRWRDLAKLWPAVLMAAPWLIITRIQHLPNDLTLGEPLQRLFAADAARIARAVIQQTREPWAWAVIAATLLIAKQRRSEAFALTAIAVQLAFVIGVYFITPHDLEWHVGTSWMRVARQILAPAMFVSTMMLARTFAVSPRPASGEKGQG